MSWLYHLSPVPFQWSPKNWRKKLKNWPLDEDIFCCIVTFNVLSCEQVLNMNCVLCRTFTCTLRFVYMAKRYSIRMAIMIYSCQIKKMCDVFYPYITLLVGYTGKKIRFKWIFVWMCLSIWRKNFFIFFQSSFFQGKMAVFHFYTLSTQKY